MSPYVYCLLVYLAFVQQAVASNGDVDGAHELIQRLLEDKETKSQAETRHDGHGGHDTVHMRSNDFECMAKMAMTLTKQFFGLGHATGEFAEHNRINRAKQDRQVKQVILALDPGPWQFSYRC